MNKFKTNHTQRRLLTLSSLIISQQEVNLLIIERNVFPIEKIIFLISKSDVYPYRLLWWKCQGHLQTKMILNLFGNAARLMRIHI